MGIERLRNSGERAGIAEGRTEENEKGMVGENDRWWYAQKTFRRDAARRGVITKSVKETDVIFKIGKRIHARGTRHGVNENSENKICERRRQRESDLITVPYTREKTENGGPITRYPAMPRRGPFLRIHGMRGRWRV